MIIFKFHHWPMSIFVSKNKRWLFHIQPYYHISCFEKDNIKSTKALKYHKKFMKKLFKSFGLPEPEYENLI